MFTDSYCHITYEDYSDIPALIKSAKENGIYRMINNGADEISNKEVLEISLKYKEILPALGIHPEYANDYKKTSIDFIEKNIDKIVAIGEIGLDYHYDGYDKDKQKELFELQLTLAEKYNKSVIIHSRDATEDTIQILKNYKKIKGVIHCFSGSLETAKIYIGLGYKLGIGGVLTFKNSKLYKIIEELPLEAFVIETDSPYLSPEPKRGDKNEPAFVKYVAEKICEIKSISLEELSKITEKNLHDIFDI